MLKGVIVNVVQSIPSIHWIQTHSQSAGLSDLPYCKLALLLHSFLAFTYLFFHLFIHLFTPLVYFLVAILACVELGNHPSARVLLILKKNDKNPELITITKRWLRMCKDQ